MARWYLVNQIGLQCCKIIKAYSNILQHGKVIIWNNNLYFGNSSNVPQPISVDLSSYATQSWVSSNYATKSHTHSDYATKNNPTLTGTIHLNSTDIRMGANNSSSNVKVKFGDGEYIYLHEDSDDHLTFYSKKGIDFTSQSNSGTFTVNGQTLGGGVTSSTLTSYYGDLRVESGTYSGNGTTSTSSHKIYLSNYPLLVSVFTSSVVRAHGLIYPCGILTSNGDLGISADTGCYCGATSFAVTDELDKSGRTYKWVALCSSTRTAP